MAIGSGVVQSGSFASVDWSTGNKYLKIEIDPTGGASYALAGTTELLSVPYALFAGKSATSSQWKDNPDGINYDEGRVGIGTAAPSAWLNVSKNASGTDRVLLRLENTSNGNDALTTNYVIAGTGTNANTMELISTAQSYFPNVAPGPGVGMLRSGKLALVAWGSTAYPTSYISFYTGGTFPDNTADNLERVRIDQNGLVGIGVMAPRTKLHVSSGDVYIDNFNNGVVMVSPNGQCWRVTIDNAGTLASTAIACP
jgi:hypothetical protein